MIDFATYIAFYLQTAGRRDNIIAKENIIAIQKRDKANQRSHSTKQKKPVSLRWNNASYLITFAVVFETSRAFTVTPFAVSPIWFSFLSFPYFGLEGFRVSVKAGLSMQTQRVSHCMRGAEFTGAIKELKPCTWEEIRALYTHSAPHHSFRRHKLNGFHPRGRGRGPSPLLLFAYHFHGPSCYNNLYSCSYCRIRHLQNNHNTWNRRCRRHL